EAGWDKARLAVERARAEIGGSAVTAYGAVRLKGRQFYELKGLGFSDLESVTLEAGRFDLAKALRAALPEPPLLSGEFQGRFSYSPETGFHGECRADNVQPAATKDRVALRRLRLRGEGDTLNIQAITV